ncbi:hypothetical protein HKD37_08G021461 [Glycine soja]
MHPYCLVTSMMSYSFASIARTIMHGHSSSKYLSKVIKNLWGHVDDTNFVPNKENQSNKYVVGSQGNQVMAWIIDSVDPHIVFDFRPFMTVTKMWTYLKNIYSQNNTTRRFRLEHEIDNLSISEFYFQFMNIWVEYTHIVYKNLSNESQIVVQ